MTSPKKHRESRNFLDALGLQAVVIGALMMREIHTRYGRENLGFVWLIAEPFIFCMGVIVIWSTMHGRYEHDVLLLPFVVTGYMPLLLLRHIMGRAVHCFRSNASLLYHRQVRMLDLLLARFVLEILGIFISYLVIAFMFYAAGLYSFPEDWGAFYLGWLYATLFSVGIGLILGSLTEIHEWTEKLVGPFGYFMLPVSGAFFMVDWLPGKFQKYVLWIPTVNAYELIRSGQFGSSVRVHYDLGYVSFVCALLIAIGLILSRNVHKHLVVE